MKNVPILHNQMRLILRYTSLSAFISRDVAQLTIDHAMSSEQGTYDYFEYLPQQTEAYAKWIDKLKMLYESN